MSIEAMKQALEALNLLMRDYGAVHSAGDLEMQPAFHQAYVAVEKLRQAIEQAEKQEGWVLREVYFSEGELISHREPQPVAWANKKGQFKVHKEADEIFKSTAMPFYSAPVPAHTDHPMRHWDRTCPACVYESDMNQERVDETAKDRHEWAMQQMVEENQRLGLYDDEQPTCQENRQVADHATTWVGLTDERAQELRELADRFSEGWHEGIKIDASDIILLLDVADAIEANLKEKNT